MNTMEKLKQASELLESIYYDLEFNGNVSEEDKRKISFAEEYVNDVLNTIKD